MSDKTLAERCNSEAYRRERFADGNSREKYVMELLRESGAELSRITEEVKRKDGLLLEANATIDRICRQLMALLRESDAELSRLQAEVEGKDGLLRHALVDVDRGADERLAGRHILAIRIRREIGEPT